jgi:hypothetical protein
MLRDAKFLGRYLQVSLHLFASRIVLSLQSINITVVCFDVVFGHILILLPELDGFTLKLFYAQIKLQAYLAIK